MNIFGYEDLVDILGGVITKLARFQGSFYELWGIFLRSMYRIRIQDTFLEC